MVSTTKQVQHYFPEKEFFWDQYGIHGIGMYRFGHMVAKIEER